MWFRHKQGTETYNDDPRSELTLSITQDGLWLQQLQYRMNNLETAYLKAVDDMSRTSKELERRINVLETDYRNRVTESLRGSARSPSD